MYSLSLCNCHQVSKPNIGETCPSQVRADVTINLNMRDIVKAEWEGKILVIFLDKIFLYSTGYLLFIYYLYCLFQR